MNSYSIISYGKAKDIRVDRGVALRVQKGILYKQGALLLSALSCCSHEGRWSFVCEGRYTNGNEFGVYERMGEVIQGRRCRWFAYSFGPCLETYHGQVGQGCHPSCHRVGQAMRKQVKDIMGEEDWQGGELHDLQAFFVSIGTRYKRIRECLWGVPSQQHYEYRFEKLQELEFRVEESLMALYCSDESNVCTEGYVLYGWQQQGKNVLVLSQRVARINILGMITFNNQYEGFTIIARITAEKIISFLGDFAFQVTKDTFIVFDNVIVHRNRWIKELRPIWEKRVLFIFFPPYSP